MRLIDADALADALFDKRKSYPQWVADVIGDMQEAVVYCKDCEKRGFDDCPVNGWMPNKADGDWFCADGEKKDD